MKYAAVGAAIGYFWMLFVVSISTTGTSIGDFVISKTMVFLETRGASGTYVFDWKLTVPVLVGLGAGFLYGRGKN